jgi:hypothetical protein
MVNENGNNKKQHNTKQLKKKEYFCKRCGYSTLIYSNFKRHINRKTKCKRVSQKGGGNELTLEDKRQAILKPYLKQFTNDLQKFQGDIKIIYLNKQIREYQRKLREDPKLFLNKKEIRDEMNNHFDLGLKMLNSILEKKTIQSELTNDDLKFEVKRIIVHLVEKEIVVTKEKDVQNGEQKVKEKISKDYPCIDKFYKEPEIDVLRDKLNTILTEKTEFIERIRNNIKEKSYDSIRNDLINIRNSIKLNSEFRDMRRSQKILHAIRKTVKYKAFQKNYAEYLDRDNETTINQLLFTLEQIQQFEQEDVPPKIINSEFMSMNKQKTNNSQITIPIRVECTFNCRKAGYRNLSYSCEKQQEGCFIKKLNKPKDPKTGVKPT